jgi:hypothetical protein
MVSEQLAVAGGAIVEILATELPRAGVTPIGGRGRARVAVEPPSSDRRLSRSR